MVGTGEVLDGRVVQRTWKLPFGVQAPVVWSQDLRGRLIRLAVCRHVVDAHHVFLGVIAKLLRQFVVECLINLFDRNPFPFHS
jgi:hypothetical protein